MLEAEEFPTGIANLYSSLPDVNIDDFLHSGLQSKRLFIFNLWPIKSFKDKRVGHFKIILIDLFLDSKLPLISKSGIQIFGLQIHNLPDV